MAGAVAANPHEGSRSEVLADYLFTGWGTVTPVRRQDDYGIDLYCTLTERRGQRAAVTDYYVVQVKSNTDPWIFEGEESVRWLVEYPTPLFLACVDKKSGVLKVYHVTPRFYARAMPPLPPRLELRPEDTEEGTFINWENGQSFSLSAPILRVTVADLLNEATMRELREVFAYWVRQDGENCDLARFGLLRFRMPPTYEVNRVPCGAMGELGNRVPELSLLTRGMLTAAESAECIGGQLGSQGDKFGALLAALFVNHLHQNYKTAFKDAPRWSNRLPGDLGRIVAWGLNKFFPGEGKYLYQGVDEVTAALKDDPIVKKFLDEIE